MAVVPLSSLSVPAGALPPVCLKTGVPTQDLVRVRGRAEPAWAGFTIFFGLFAWLFVSTASSRPYELWVPFAAKAWERHRTLRRAALATVAAGMFLTVVAAVFGAGDAPVLLLLSVLGLVGFVQNEWRNSFGVQLRGDGGVLLTRVHEDFAAATRRSTTPV